MEKNNLDIYEKSRDVPQEAQKKIFGGRLKGMTDINPMYRIKKLTELFGVVGFGWYYEVQKQWFESGANNEVVAFCNINLFVKMGEEWSKPIFGNGGASFVSKEKLGLYTSDECFKMALTDAISVACKSIGIGADVYWEKDRTKYNQSDNSDNKQQAPKQQAPNLKKPNDKQKEKMLELVSKRELNLRDIKSKFLIDEEFEKKVISIIALSE